jgi:hypothetical protein
MKLRDGKWIVEAVEPAMTELEAVALFGPLVNAQTDAMLARQDEPQTESTQLRGALVFDGVGVEKSYAHV